MENQKELTEKELKKRVMNPEKKTLDGMDEIAAYIEVKLEEKIAEWNREKVTPVETLDIG